jgi:hypothetical protein
MQQAAELLQSGNAWFCVSGLECGGGEEAASMTCKYLQYLMVFVPQLSFTSGKRRDAPALKTASILAHCRAAADERCAAAWGCL